MTDNTMAAGAAQVTTAAPALSPKTSANSTTFAVILSLSFCHLLNDMMQSLVPALYPILKDSYALSFSQVGLITLAFQFTASMLQPLVGLYTDRKPQPYSLMVGMGFTLVGLVLMSRAESYPAILLAAMLIGMGSSVFHPEASRVARMAAGGRYGLAQSLFQVGGNLGQASGPLLAAFIVVPRGQPSLLWFSGAALVALTILFQVGNWYRARRVASQPAARGAARLAHPSPHGLSRGRVIFAVTILVLLLFSKNVYQASLGSYYIFYLMEKFHLSVTTSQFYLFAFLIGIVIGTLLGGAVGDKVGRIPVIWFSILGALPFALMLPHANLFWTGVLAVLVAMIIASAFAAILVYAQELMPGRVGGGGHVLRLLVRPGRAGAAARQTRRSHHRHGLPDHAVPAMLGPVDGLPAASARNADTHTLIAHRRRPWTLTPTRSAVRSTTGRSRLPCSPTSCSGPRTARPWSTGTARC
jgi:FSR family fosmidomycin resistance protein-like MFS transporter